MFSDSRLSVAALLLDRRVDTQAGALYITWIWFDEFNMWAECLFVCVIAHDEGMVRIVPCHCDIDADTLFILIDLHPSVTASPLCWPTAKERNGKLTYRWGESILGIDLNVFDYTDALYYDYDY